MLNLKNFSSSQLFNLLQKKDKSAFEYFYDQYAPALYGAILKLVNDKATADRVLQKSFLLIWQDCESVDSLKQSAFIWMYSIANKVALAELKRSQSEFVPELVA